MRAQENHDQFPAKSLNTEEFLKQGLFKKIEQEVELYKLILYNEITLFGRNTRIDNLVEKYKNKSIILFVLKYDINPHHDTFSTFMDLNWYRHDLLWAINSELFDQDQSKSKARIIFYQNGLVEFDNYQEIFKLHNELGKLNMPQGFIYAQINDNDNPNKYWPNNEWIDVSEQYSGLFFRVIGGQSRALDRNQEQSYPSTEIESTVNLSKNVHNKINITIIPGQWSDYVRTGGTYPNKKRIGLSFHMTNDEVRPKNTAIRIWKCLGQVKVRKLWTRDRIKRQISSTGMSMMN